MAKSTSTSIKTSPKLVKWIMHNSSGPQLAFHVGGVIQNTLYIHGGISTTRSTEPFNSFFTFTPDDDNLVGGVGVWTDITTPDSPRLSHHACVPLADRYLLLIGGWNGKARSSDIFVFDTVANRWSKPDCTGFPTGAGLSSHTATELTNGDILIIGREGSLRTQRRSGNAFLLRGSIETGGFKYSDYPIAVASRSGHTTSSIGSRLLVVIGGRDDRLAERHPNIEAVVAKSNDFITSIVRKADSSLKKLSKLPSGRKNHVCFSSAGGVLIHGGETFDGRSREPVAEMFVAKFSPRMTTFYDLGSSDVGRAGHVVFFGCGDSEVFIHGGIGPRNVVTGDVYKLAWT